MKPDFDPHVGCFVDLELIAEPVVDEIENPVEGELVVAMSWRDSTVVW
jgi:hypothetical protein